MSAIQIANLLVDKCVTSAALATVQNHVAPSDVVVEFYCVVPEATPEDLVQETIEAYEAMLDAKWIQAAA